MSQIDNKKLSVGCVAFFVFYLLAMLLFWAIAGEQLSWRAVTIQNEPVNAVVGEINEGVVVSQSFDFTADTIDTIVVPIATNYRTNTGVVTFRVRDVDEDAVVFKVAYDASSFKGDTKVNILEGTTVSISPENRFELEITANSQPGEGIAIYADKEQEYSGQLLTINNAAEPGALSIEVAGRKRIPFLRNFLCFSALLGGVLVVYSINLLYRNKNGKKSAGLNLIIALKRYGFLLGQLVARDFKVKYKRSVLGVLWSFLNPLLTMLVQYVVFSTVFRQDISNFPVYLLTGVIFFNFFNESCNLGIGAIVDNSSLITKVYIPKYIFPVSRICSSGINLLLSLIPLFLVALLTGTPITPYYALLPFAILCLVLFCLGCVMLLSATMVFFRDVRFIWSVLSMLWMYATPIFYPESIVPPQFQIVLRMNPMYHFIRFGRDVIMYGISPTPQAYFYCVLAALIPLIIGTLVFKKTQNKFVLHI